ncbi:MAG: type 4a pilus biogenesis protein PilO, partial [Pontibacterium sp.]
MNFDALKNAFSGFDPNDLDFATAGSWPVGVKIVTFVLVFVGIVAAGLHFYVDDKNVSLKQEIKQEQQLRNEYKAKAFEVANLDALRRQMADVEDRFAEMLRQLPSQNEVPGLLDDITNI